MTRIEDLRQVATLMRSRLQGSRILDAEVQRVLSDAAPFITVGGVTNPYSTSVEAALACVRTLGPGWLWGAGQKSTPPVADAGGLYIGAHAYVGQEDDMENTEDGENDTLGWVHRYAATAPLAILAAVLSAHALILEREA